MNPELRRLLWLEISPQRLWLFPAVILGSVLLLDRSTVAAALIRNLGMGGFIVLTLLWGARQAASAALDEARGRTWEIQRMSAMTPWSMTAGKLLGATAIPWYAGLLCLAVYLVYQPAGNLAVALQWALLAVLAAVIAQALALTAALVSMHRQRDLHRGTNILVVLFVLCLLLPELAPLAVPGFGPLTAVNDAVAWYGRCSPGLTFSLLLLGAFAAWALTAAHRVMCMELEVRTTPWVWLAFIAFLTLLAAGFEDHQTAPALVRRWSSIAAVFACALSYVAGFAFARDPMQYRRLMQAWREGRYRRALEEMPLWLCSALCAVVFSAIALLVGADDGISNERIDNLGAVALALTLMTWRDMALLNWVSFGHAHRRADIKALIWIAVLNCLLPGLLTASALGAIAALIKPTPFATPLSAIAIGLLQATIAIVLAVFAYRAAMRTQVTR